MSKHVTKTKFTIVKADKKPIKVANYIITMGQRWKLVPTAEFNGDPDLQGQVDKDRREIQFKSGIAMDAMLDTILHEVVHAYGEINRFPPILPEDPHDLEEYVAQWTAGNMIDFIRNNPAFVMLLISTWKENK